MLLDAASNVSASTSIGRVCKEAKRFEYPLHLSAILGEAKPPTTIHLGSSVVASGEDSKTTPRLPGKLDMGFCALKDKSPI